MKTRNLFIILLTLMLLVSMIGCAPAKNNDPDTTEQSQSTVTTEPSQPTQNAELPKTDRSGNPITLPEQVNAIISMAPSITQTLIDLGLQDKLVAVDTYSAMYFDLGDLPTFDMMEPDTEKMIVLNADLVFTSGMSAASGSDPFKPLRDVGACIADIPSASSMDATLEDTRFIAACVGAQKECEELIEKFQKEVDVLASIGKGIEDKKNVLVEIACAPDIYTVGNGTFIQEMLNIIGAENIFGNQEGYLAVTEESVVTLNPDVILTTVNYIENPVDEILGRIGWENVNAVSNKNVFQVDTNAVTLPNLHVIDGMKQMAKMIYPDAYAEIADPFAQESAE